MVPSTSSNNAVDPRSPGPGNADASSAGYKVALEFIIEPEIIDIVAT
jgi:hypothetical protein